MITKSIERAQKKVEENNFGIRKRLLEYDDVMNKQRTVIYSKRNHALFGERLAIDLDNAFYATAQSVVANSKETADYEGFTLDVIVNFGIQTNISKDEFIKEKFDVLVDTLYHEAYTAYQNKKQAIAQQAVPVFANIRNEQGAHIENVAVPFTDGKIGLQIVANLDKTIQTNGVELLHALERSITLNFIDNAWKEHLRNMDDLKQSVQTATYEQKDPLVIYKKEAFELFRKMDAEVSKNMVNFLSHAGIPIEQDGGAEIREGREEQTDLSHLQSNKAAIDAAGEDYAANQNDYYDPTPAPKQQPIQVGPKIGRNDPCPCGSGKKYKQCHGA
ncbi:MAG TPA: hypothetical protein DCQ29_11900 [Chitinophagaceae bacterium]|nr:hypothetical protein [Chitinophagaceae bacterium]